MTGIKLGYQHQLLRARDWQDRPQFDELCNWWRSGAAGICAIIYSSLRPHFALMLFIPVATTGPFPTPH